ncbi:MAG: arylesterase [Ginsengibacter sp.]
MKKRYITGAFALLFFIVCCKNNQKSPVAQTHDSVRKPGSNERNKTIIFFGNSLTAGYGLSPSEAFPALIQHTIDSLGLKYKVINAGVSGETSSGGNGRIDWILRQPLDVFVLELGANDGLRGIPLSETKKSLQSIIDKVKAKNPSVKMILAGMQIPPNMGQAYTTEFKNIYPELATKNKITLIPFLLKGVGGETRLNQGDGIHPTAEGHQIVAATIWQILKPML